jgi:inner membrane protein
MLIAHWPAGYLCTPALDRLKPGTFSVSRRRWMFWAILAGSIFPDVDLLFFYFIDHRHHHHHLYPTHLPFAWLCLYALTLGLSIIYKRKNLAAVATAFVFGVFLHLVLDTPMGGIAWLFPFSAKLFHFINVPPGQSWWLWSFVFHWSFLSELAICLAAFVLFLKRRYRAG